MFLLLKTVIMYIKPNKLINQQKLIKHVRMFSRGLWIFVSIFLIHLILDKLSTSGEWVGWVLLVRFIELRNMNI